MSTIMRQAGTELRGKADGADGALTPEVALGASDGSPTTGLNGASPTHPLATRGDFLEIARWLMLGVGGAVVVAAICLHLGGLSLLVSLLLILAGAAQVIAVVVLHRFRAREMAQLQQSLDRAHLLARLNSSIIGSFAMAIDAKDQHTQGHTERVRDIAVMIGEEMKLTEDEIESLRMAAMLHDIGKLAVPDYILSKPAQLTQEEMRKVQTHTLVGAALLESVRFPWPVVPIIRSHHEWCDGTGYPDGLTREQIPLGARILAVADVYDALLSHRPYRPAMSVDEAVKFMHERVGTQFDPEIITICFRTLTAQQSKGRPGFIFDAEGQAEKPSAGSAGQSSIFMNIRQAHQELLALYEIVQTMGPSLDVQETMELVIGKTKRIIDFATCVLFLCQQDDGYLVAAAASGPHADELKGRRLQLGVGVSGVVAQTGIASGLGKPALEDLSVLLGAEARSCGLAHVVSAPLMHESTLIGTLTLYRPGSRPFTEDDARLVVAVARQAAIAINNARQHETTRQSAMTDQLTGLANARHFFMRLEQELSRARRDQKCVSLVAVDLNGLKQINDSYGHQQGDRVLRVIAEVFRRHVRDYDTVVRYAGDEFFIILPDTTNKTAVETTRRIKEAVRETQVEMLPGRLINLSASFGVATFPGDAEHADALIAVADQAMYADKRLSQQAALLHAQGNGKETG